jgi:hypothetical protein
MKAPFTFPITLSAMENFRHPDPANIRHGLHMDGDALVSMNGYIILRASRGYWLATDFPPAPPEFAVKASSLPWNAFPPDGDGWRRLDDKRGDLYARAPISMFTDKHKPTPSPVWRVGGLHMIRLSHLQQLARLPRCEVFTTGTRDDFAFFRFNGGLAIVPRDKRLSDPRHPVSPSANLFPPAP